MGGIVRVVGVAGVQGMARVAEVVGVQGVVGETEEVGVQGVVGEAGVQGWTGGQGVQPYLFCTCDHPRGGALLPVCPSWLAFPHTPCQCSATTLSSSPPQGSSPTLQ